MIVRWSNRSKTYVRVEVMGSAYEIPTDEKHPDWQRIKAMIDAGTLTIAPYEPPTPPADFQG